MDGQDKRITTSQQALSLKREPLLRRIAPAVGLFFLAPLFAEYLIGYDTSTGNLRELLMGLLFFGPLYGGPALIIREVARRSGRGWPAMLLLALAFGVIQAGLVDHSLFNTSYRDIDTWQEDMNRTLIPLLGIGASNAVNFLSGHMIWSISVPIAIVETLVPQRRTTPWLGKFGLTVTIALYLLVSVLIYLDHVESEQFLPSAAQLIGAAAVVVALVGAAFTVGRRAQPPAAGPAPNPWRVGVAAFAALNLSVVIEIVLGGLGITTSFDTDWWGVALNIGLLAVLAVLVVRWSQREGWRAAHRLALAGGALMTRVWLAFLVEPLGNVALSNKLMHNAGFALGSVLLLVMAARTAREAPESHLAASTSERGQ